MIDFSAIMPFLVLTGLILVPAIIIFSIVTYLRLRKESFRRHRSGTRSPRSEG